MNLKVECAAGPVPDKDQPANPQLCRQCKLASACYKDAELREAQTVWAAGCAYTSGDGVCNNGEDHDVPGLEHPVKLWCPKDQPRGGAATKAMCSACVAPAPGSHCYREVKTNAFKAFCGK